MKPFWKSKTFWVNVVSFLISAVMLASDQQLFGLEPEVYVMAISVLNIGLRFLTTGAISLRASE